MEKHQVLIIGGGNAGISVAAQLLRKRPKLDIAIVEPSDKHYYQPAWTLVGGGDYDVNDTVRPEASVMPKKAKWIKDRAEAFEPENQVVHLENRLRLYGGVSRHTIALGVGGGFGRNTREKWRNK
jgi:sulfide:quinone oxidoreductase